MSVDWTDPNSTGRWWRWYDSYELGTGFITAGPLDAEPDPTVVQDDIPWAYAGAIIDKHNEQMLDVLGMIGRMSEFVGNIDPSIMDAFVFGENIRAQDIYHDEQASAGTHLYDEHCLRCNRLQGSATLVEPNTQED